MSFVKKLKMIDNSLPPKGVLPMKNIECTLLPRPLKGSCLLYSSRSVIHLAQSERADLTVQ